MELQKANNGALIVDSAPYEIEKEEARKIATP
jgi:hypothetical protein